MTASGVRLILLLRGDRQVEIYTAKGSKGVVKKKDRLGQFEKGIYNITDSALHP
jgi:hypothetical protein